MSIKYNGKKIGFVTPWFGMDIPGGAEAELRGLALHLKDAGVPLEILTTCVEKFASDWNRNFYKPGEYSEGGILVRRFKVRKRNTKKFDAVNLKLINHLIPLRDEEEKTFLEEMINSPDLYSFMDAHKDEYGLFVLIPYMFGTTYYGSKIAPEKTAMIPCFHDESYFYMRAFWEAYGKIAGFIYNARPEMELVHRTYQNTCAREIVMGLGMDTDITSSPEDFRSKFGIKDPYVLYAGRKDAGKNVDTLLKCFSEYKKYCQKTCREGATRPDIKLVLIGGGDICIPESVKDDVYDLGFVDVQDKYNAMGAAELLCQPSFNESFSIVIMESWLCGRPVLVADQCAVTKNFVCEAGGGLYFADYPEFAGALDYMLGNEDTAKAMGENGKRYVLEHFSWDVIIEKYTEYFNSVIDRKNGD